MIGSNKSLCLCCILLFNGCKFCMRALEFFENVWAWRVEWLSSYASGDGFSRTTPGNVLHIHHVHAARLLTLFYAANLSASGVNSQPHLLPVYATRRPTGSEPEKRSDKTRWMWMEMCEWVMAYVCVYVNSCSVSLSLSVSAFFFFLRLSPRRER